MNKTYIYLYDKRSLDSCCAAFLAKRRYEQMVTAFQETHRFMSEIDMWELDRANHIVSLNFPFKPRQLKALYQLNDGISFDFYSRDIMLNFTPDYNHNVFQYGKSVSFNFATVNQLYPTSLIRRITFLEMLEERFDSKTILWCVPTPNKTAFWDEFTKPIIGSNRVEAYFKRTFLEE